MFTNGEPDSWVRGYTGEREVETEGSRMQRHRRRLRDSPTFHAVWSWAVWPLRVFVVVVMGAYWWPLIQYSLTYWFGD